MKKWIYAVLGLAIIWLAAFLVSAWLGVAVAWAYGVAIGLTLGWFILPQPRWATVGWAWLGLVDRNP